MEARTAKRKRSRLAELTKQYVDRGAEYFETRHREQQIQFVLKRAQQLA
jgi:hypothetical protein